MKTSVLQMSVLVLVLTAAVVTTVTSTPIFDLRPSCIYRGREYRVNSNIPTGTCQRCWCERGHVRCTRRFCRRNN
ncbi:hypothetical protein PoB_004684800 [Plakobranchus ocellatus]|uniref:Pacifastin domain-containing protein n=1 Tax=Plakobranchus ocellatus TaxID=259542 RepID=A0AAV4BMH3_9GAST|nr:hypothetical protein PoB_004684800 [Plakobranchus ocellatus]